MSVLYSENSEPVVVASMMAGRLVRAEAERSGRTMREAAGVVARRAKSSASALLALIYSPPKDIGARFFFALADDFERFVRSEIRTLEAELGSAHDSLGAHPGEIKEIETTLQALRARLKVRS